MCSCFLNDRATTYISTYGHTLSLDDALPVSAIGRDRRALRALQRRGRQLQPVEHAALGGRLLALACRRRFRRWALRGRRSEEHTSELQSLMRISYAVFCLKKNKTKTPTDVATRAATNYYTQCYSITSTQ